MYYTQVTEQIVFDSFSKKYKSKDDVSKILHSLTVEQLGELRVRYAQTRLDIIVTLTTRCDLHCAYCFENHIPRENMQLDVCIQVVEAIKTYIIEHGIERVDCVLFGGEPLLNKDVLEYFVSEMRKFCDDKNIRLNMLLTTNGVLFNPTEFSFLVKYGVTDVQVTFDGTEQTNNRRRCSLDPKQNTYQAIINNFPAITACFEHVMVKFNFDLDNYNEYPMFLADLDNVLNAGPYKDRITIILETIHETPFAHYGHSFEMRGKNLAVKFVDLIRTTIDMGFNYVTKVFTTPCMHTSPNSFMIDTSGNAFSCISAFGIPEFKLGSFMGKESLALQNKRQRNNRITTLKAHCSSCCYLPICWGGCAYLIKTEGKDIFTDVLCRRSYFDTVVKEFYKEITLKYGVNQIE